MTLQQWARELTGELEEAGYEVYHYQGFPLVKCPLIWDRGVALIKWTSPSGLPTYKSIYAEGMLFTPGPT